MDKGELQKCDSTSPGVSPWRNGKRAWRGSILLNSFGIAKIAYPHAWALQNFYMASIWLISPYVTPTDPSVDKRWMFELDCG
ncbi:hypothetical protein J6590_040486 [Homalodisca vitripennis]|nr:hypothetical protein J6590_040486 [Homalodisca vitripennis]